MGKACWYPCQEVTRKAFLTISTDTSHQMNPVSRNCCTLKLNQIAFYSRDYTYELLTQLLRLSVNV